MRNYEKPEFVITTFETEEVMLPSSKFNIDGGSADFDYSWLEL